MKFDKKKTTYYMLFFFYIYILIKKKQHIIFIYPDMTGSTGFGQISEVLAVFIGISAGLQALHRS